MCNFAVLPLAIFFNSNFLDDLIVWRVNNSAFMVFFKKKLAKQSLYSYALYTLANKKIPSEIGLIFVTEFVVTIISIRNATFFCFHLIHFRREKRERNFFLGIFFFTSYLTIPTDCCAVNSTTNRMFLLFFFRFGFS